MDTSATPLFPYAGPESLQPTIQAALLRVVDPEVAMTIVDVGLIYGVTVEPGHWHVVMTMTSAACPVTDMLLEEVQDELERIAPAGTDIEVELVWEPAWTTDRMSPRAKAFMGW